MTTNCLHNEAKEQSQNSSESGSSDEDSSADDDSSTCENYGTWDGRESDWNGCVCGKIHERPHPVFWIQCDGACESWFNVAADCVGFERHEAGTKTSWLCRKCCKNNSQALCHLLNLPHVLIYKILEFAAPPMGIIAVLYQQLAPLCMETHRAVYKERWSELWSMLLNEYSQFPTRRTRRAAKRLKQCPTWVPRSQVMEKHWAKCESTDDAHMTLKLIAKDQFGPLSLKKLRSVLFERGRLSVLINRRSSWGRTFLMECCAANFVDEGVTLRCVTELVRCGADPNTFSCNEKPYADRPVLFFVIARVMPRVIQFLIKAGATLDVEVTGQHRLVSVPSKSFGGTFTPLEFAKALKEAERTQGDKLPMYYSNKLNQCIRVLERAVRISTEIS